MRFEPRDINIYYQIQGHQVKMKLSDKLFVLKQIYKIYDDFAGALEVACEKYCSLCCTNNVVMTTLEGYLIIEYTLNSTASGLLQRVGQGASKERFLPQTTTNAIAEACLEDKDLPAENYAHAAEVCPLLTNHECPIYSVRPFACRCLVSKHDCRRTGYAEVDSLVLSVNQLFLQVVEHVDAAGWSGNLIDILTFMAHKDNRFDYEQNRLKNTAAGLIANRPIKALMIPPEHRLQMQPIINALYDLKAPVAG
jgi:hypothetical protein